jgi:hypothetical protein
VNKLKKIILSALAGLCIMNSNPVEASDHYIWNNRDYRFWIDDSSVYNSESKKWCLFKLVSENLHTGYQEKSDEPIIICKVDNEYYVYFIGHTGLPHTVDYYAGWWQFNGLNWLKDNGYLN